MTEVGLVRFKLKEGGKKRWLEWCEELRRREVLETLENEGLISEACFLSSDEKEIYYFLEAVDLERAHSVSHKFPIDKEHAAAVRSSLERSGRLKVLFNFHRS